MEKPPSKKMMILFVVHYGKCGVLCIFAVELQINSRISFDLLLYPAASERWFPLWHRPSVLGSAHLDKLKRSQSLFMRQEKDREIYLQKYPKLKKWINECWLCHCQGYDRSIVDSPNNEEVIAVRNIKRFFQPLDLNEDGLCEICARLSKKP